MSALKCDKSSWEQLICKSAAILGSNSFIGYTNKMSPDLWGKAGIYIGRWNKMNFITYYKIYIEENNVQELNILQCYAFNFLSYLGTLVIAEMLT